MDFLSKYFKYENNINVSGLTSELNVFYLLNYFKKNNNHTLVVTSTLYEATKLYNSLITYTSKVLLYPMDDFLTSVAIAESPELKFTRLETLNKIKTGKHIVIVNLMSYLKYMPKKDTEEEYNLVTGKSIDRSKLIEKLEEYGYNKESLVTSTGEYAVRGFIIDVFLLHEKSPVRIELDGNNIEAIHYFNEVSQITTDKIKEISIDAINENINTNYDNIVNYLGNPAVFYIDYSQIKASYLKLAEDILNYNNANNINKKHMYDLDEVNSKFSLYINTIDSKNSDFIIDSMELINFNEDFELLKTKYHEWSNKKKTVIFCLSNEKQIQIIAKLIPEAKIIKQKINKGFIINDLVLIGESDIENTRKINNSFKSSYKFGKRVKSYEQLEIGDYVVHVAHGIGIYNGLTKLSKNKIEKDFLQILYSGNDKIYVPAEKINSIYKYSDKEGTPPKINKLGGDSWKKTKNYIQAKIKDISLELIELYKKRLGLRTDKYLFYPEEEVFASEFKYDLTIAQHNSVRDIVGDLSKDYPMDRLLCGDVGFGKTEVAFRAMFNTVLNNHQVMYLCPTTILADQQYKVAVDRFKNWPITIAVLNRLVTPSKVKTTIEDFKNGKIDILIGTHRILSNDVIPKDLGLLVVDEEQRFGVTHKEKLKKLKTDINILTLSATPIPRTLKMALSGIRDLSVIDTPPFNRYPIQTYVISEDDMLIKDAIFKELSRDGQVFILYNKVEDIEIKTNHIRKLIPDANVSFAHGQMSKNELENIMETFVTGEINILVCTTIIESGIDIPNVNTLIIYDADKFGLSQLYQIRGRVGRSNKIGYAYLLYNPSKVLTEVATKRLKTIKEFTELGSGYKIAMRDLAIRGAGDVFGVSQAGFVDSVGISLYLKMMEDEIRRQKGEEVIEEDIDTKALIDVKTHISDDYISDEDIKIEVHKLINSVDSFAKIEEIKSEIENRFGTIPEYLITYMYEKYFEYLVGKLSIKHIKDSGRVIEIIIPKEVSDKIKGDKLLIHTFQISSSFNIKYLSGQIILSYNYINEKEEYVYNLAKLLDLIYFDMNK